MTATPLYEPQDWLLVRAPLLPVEDYLCGADGAGLAGRPGDEPARLAIGVASPSLLAAVDRAPSGRDAERVGRKVLRYRIRMATRPTPYGLFAGVALGRFADRTDLALAGRDTSLWTRTRPDMEWLLRLVAAQEADADVRAGLRLVANPAAFERAGRLWLSEQAPVDGSGPRPGVSVRATPPVRLALGAARQPVARGALRASLVESTGAPEAKVEALLDQLWAQTFLLTDLRPPLTTDDPSRHVAARLDHVPGAAQAAAGLRRVRAEAARWDAAPAGERAGAFRALLGAVAERSDGPPLVDMAIGLAGDRVSHLVGTDTARAAELLLRLSPWPAGPPYLSGYRHAFEARYPEGARVPLLELVDPDHGLGPGGPYGAHVFPIPPDRAGRRAQALTDVALGALHDGTMAVELDAELLARLETWSPAAADAPASLEVNVFVAAPSAAVVDEGRFRLVVGPNVGGSAAGKNLGRFADLLGPAAVDALRRSARAEEATDPAHLWAELVYCPRRFRSANVAVRPAVRGYEIVLGVAPGVDHDHVIPLDELVVSVEQGRFALRWSRTGAAVTVCAGHMLNTQQAPEVCRFLADVSRDGQPHLSGFDWGPAGGFPFLPRVEAGRIVLSLARWNVGTAVRTGELDPADRGPFAVSVGTWRRRWNVPRYVYLAEGDNRLLLDLDADAHVEELRRECGRVRPGGHLVVEEVLPGFDELWLHGPEGRFFCELVVPVVRRPAARPAVVEAANPPVERQAPAVQRLRPPGSDWLYAKLYGPRWLADDLLVDHVGPFVADVLGRGLADSWFFIRYADPDPHVRLRVHGAPDRLLATLLPELCVWASALGASGACERFSFDTYDREIERFGGEVGTGLAEAVFAIDSHLAVELVGAGDLDLDLVALATVAVDNLLAGLGLDGPARTRWLRDIVTWGGEVGDEFRRRKGPLRAALGSGLRRVDGGDAVATILDDARRALGPLGRAFDDASSAGRLGQSPATIYRSFVHLQCNRLFGADPAKERLVLGLALRTRQSLDRHPSLP